MLRVCVFATFLATCSGSNCQWNLHEKLTPPDGTGWRGAVVDPTRFNHSSEWEKYYGYQLHIKRAFKTSGSEKLNDDEVEFVKKGGILFYTIPISPPLQFTSFLGDKNSWRIKEFAKVIGAVAPAKVMVSVRFEPSLWVDPSDTKRYLGTPEEYRAMWKAFDDVFKQMGVTNVVWAMDYSTRSTDLKYHPILAALWPQDVQIDWLLFNMFQYGADTKRTFLDMFSTAYHGFENLSGVPQLYNGTNNTANYASVPNWGLGAWGADVKSGTEEQRSQYIEDSATVFSSGQFPRIKTQVYFDTEDDNTGTGSIIKDGQKKAYKDLNGISLFTQNDCSSTTSSETIVV